MQDEFARRPFWPWVVLSVYLLVATENLIFKDSTYSFASSPFFEVFASDQYDLERRFEVRFADGSSRSLAFHQWLHGVYDVSPIVGTTVWHLFKAEHVTFARGENVAFRSLMDNFFCEAPLAKQSLAAAVQIEYFGSKGVHLEHRCR